MSLFISTTSPTSEFKDSNLEQAITGLAIKLAKERKNGSLPTGPGLDVNFLLAGKHDKPAFNGMRMGRYSAGQSTLYFERSVPMNIINSSHADEFVKAVLEDVITNAEDYFRELKVEFDSESWKRVLAGIE